MFENITDVENNVRVTLCTSIPVIATNSPTVAPTTLSPSYAPTNIPTQFPTTAPTAAIDNNPFLTVVVPGIKNGDSKPGWPMVSCPDQYVVVAVCSAGLHANCGYNKVTSYYSVVVCRKYTNYPTLLDPNVPSRIIAVTDVAYRAPYTNTGFPENSNVFSYATVMAWCPENYVITGVCTSGEQSNCDGNAYVNLRCSKLSADYIIRPFNETKYTLAHTTTHRPNMYLSTLSGDESGNRDVVTTTQDVSIVFCPNSTLPTMFCSGPRDNMCTNTAFTSYGNYIPAHVNVDYGLPAPKSNTYNWMECQPIKKIKTPSPITAQTFAPTVATTPAPTVRVETADIFYRCGDIDTDPSNGAPPADYYSDLPGVPAGRAVTMLSWCYQHDLTNTSAECTLDPDIVSWNETWCYLDKNDFWTVGNYRLNATDTVFVDNPVPVDTDTYLGDAAEDLLADMTSILDAAMNMSTTLNVAGGCWCPFRPVTWMPLGGIVQYNTANANGTISGDGPGPRNFHAPLVSDPSVMYLQTLPFDQGKSAVLYFSDLYYVQRGATGVNYNVLLPSADTCDAIHPDCSFEPVWGEQDTILENIAAWWCVRFVYLGEPDATDPPVAPIRVQRRPAHSVDDCVRNNATVSDTADAGSWRWVDSRAVMGTTPFSAYRQWLYTLVGGTDYIYQWMPWMNTSETVISSSFCSVQMDYYVSFQDLYCHVDQFAATYPYIPNSTPTLISRGISPARAPHVTAPAVSACTLHRCS